MSTQQTNSKVNFYAVLIGINNYDVKPLHGCINDVIAINDFFSRLCNAQQEDGSAEINWIPKFLVAPRSEVDKKRLTKNGIAFDSDEHKPTKDKIIKAFEHFDQADPDRGDFCLLYYSGHGSYTSAPEVFKDVEPLGQLQTIVCQDSRTENGRDLFDKELAFLIAKSLENKTNDGSGDNNIPGVHFLAIMDSCHSGTNTRDADDGIITKMRYSGREIEDPNDLEGFNKPPFYLPNKIQKNGRIAVDGLQHGRYINLSAAGDNELAKEFHYREENQGEGPSKIHYQGVFTHHLLRVLEHGGTRISYRDLISRVSMEVRGQVDKQIPVLGKTLFQDDNLYFLRNRFKSIRPEYEVGMRSSLLGVEWYLNAGRLHGIVPGDSNQNIKSTIKLTDGSNRVVEVKKVEAQIALLDSTPFTKQDETNLHLKARIAQAPVPKIRVGLSVELTEVERTEIVDTYNLGKYLFIELVPEESTNLDYEIKTIVNPDLSRNFILTTPGGEIPKFLRTPNPAVLLKNINQVGNWHRTIRINNPDTSIDRKDIRVDFEVLEGVKFDLNDFEEKCQKEWPKKYRDPEQVLVVHRNNTQPAIKVQITNTSDKAYFFGALYLNSHFGVSHKYLEQGAQPVNNNQHVNLGYLDNKGRRYSGIPLNLNSSYHEYGIIERQDYLMIFVSKQRMDLSGFYQPAITFDIKRDEGFDPSLEGKKDDWFTILIPINILWEMESVRLESNKDNLITRKVGLDQKRLEHVTFSVQVPNGFVATLQASNIASAKRRLQRLETSRSDYNPKSLSPPASIWGQSTASEGVFTRNMATHPENHISILELSELSDEARKLITDDHPIVISPGDPLRDDESLMAIGYDEEADLYLPVGQTDQSGKIIITHLPPPSVEMIGKDGEDLADKNLGGSVKLFFHKFIWSRATAIHDYNLLSILSKDNNGPVSRTTVSRLDEAPDDPDQTTKWNEIKQQVKDKMDLILLVHGLIGHTQHMEEGIFFHSTIYKDFDAVLAFDYENLGTSIERTAQNLNQFITQLDIKPKSLTVIAHSMGGLIVRQWIEHEGGDKYVKKLVLAGVPNGGASMTELRKFLPKLLTLAMNGFGIPEDIVKKVVFLERFLDKGPLKTISDMDPANTFITDLNSVDNTVNTIPYVLIAGSTQEIKPEYQPQDSRWQKFWKGLNKRARYFIADMLMFGDDPNDMIVRVESMKKLPWDDVKVIDVKCDHFAYFQDKRLMKKMNENL